MTQGLSSTGRLNDGQTAASRSVGVTLLQEGLSLAESGGEFIAAWPYESLRLVEEHFPGDPLHLTSCDDKEWRLSIKDTDAVEAVAERAPHLKLRLRHRGMLRPLIVWTGWAAAGFAALWFVFFVALPRSATWASHSMPVSWEKDLGESVYGGVIRLLTRFEDNVPMECSHPPGRQALEQLLADLTGSIDTPYDFKVTVLNLEKVNAFALPGGRIVIFEGLIDFAESPNELAAVLAHEIGHVKERHGTERLMHGLGLGFIVGFIFGDVSGSAIAGAGQFLLDSAHSREAEVEADRIALALLREAGIGNGGMADFFGRLHEEQGDTTLALQLMSTHPDLGARAAAARAAFSEGESAMTAEAWRQVQDICRDTDGWIDLRFQELQNHKSY